MRLAGKIDMRKAWTVTKLILAAIVLTAFAWMPFIASFLPKDVSYAQSTQVLHLKLGKNRVGNLEIMIDERGKAWQVKKTKPRINNQTCGFRNLRTFLSAGTQFFSLLAFCIFFNWCDKQPKTRYLLTLKRYVWGLFLFVSLWFTYAMLIVKTCNIQGLAFYIGIYTAATVTFVVGCCCFRYYHRTFKYKHLRISALMNFLFDIQYEYPGAMQECMKEIGSKRKIREDEAKVRSLKSFGELGRKIEPELMARRPRPAKFIAIGIVLSVFALLPLSYQFASRHVDYSFTVQRIPLKPGLNTIGDLSLTLGPEGKPLYATLTKRKVIHKVFGFKNLKTFLQNIGSSLSCLSLCFFSFWYDQQQKNPCVRALKRYAFGVFLLVSLWFSCWALIPRWIPIPQIFYQRGIQILIGTLVATLLYLCVVHVYKFKLFYMRMVVFFAYVARVRAARRWSRDLKALCRDMNCETEVRNLFEEMEGKLRQRKFKLRLTISSEELRLIYLRMDKVHYDRQTFHLKHEVDQMRYLREAEAEGMYNKREVKRIIKSFHDWIPPP